MFNIILIVNIPINTAYLRGHCLEIRNYLSRLEEQDYYMPPPPNPVDGIYDPKVLEQYFNKNCFKPHPIKKDDSPHHDPIRIWGLMLNSLFNNWNQYHFDVNSNWNRIGS